jgi:outer membrane protein TolC
MSADPSAGQAHASATADGEHNTLDRGELRAGVRLPLLQDLRTDARRAGIGASEAETRAAQHALAELLLDLERDAAGAYFGWVAAGQRLRVLENLVELARFRDTQIRTKVELGALNLREQSAADAQMALFDAQAELGFSTVRVLTVMGESP